MQDLADQELLRRYAHQGSEAAFAELVKRHCNLVWAAARRVSGQADVAQDVAQIVFCDLARKAAQLAERPSLAGWLYRAGCHAASKYVRRESRRAQREHAAMQIHGEIASRSTDAPAAEEWDALLDQAVADLPDADREILVLRYFCRRSLGDVGSQLGTNEDAAQKRVSRALEKLRAALRQRGVLAPGTAVVAALTVAGTQTAPVGLAAAVSATALAQSGVAAGSLLSLIALMKTKVSLAIVGGAAVASALWWQQHRIDQLHDANAALRKQTAELTASMAEPQSAASNPANESARLRDQQAELLRLRAEVARLRQAAAAPNSAAAETRVARAEAQSAAVEAEVAFRNGRIYIIDAGKQLGLAARLYAADHQGAWPTSFDSMKPYLPTGDGAIAGEVTVDAFEFFPQPRPLSESESDWRLILFRERAARSIPPAALSEEALTAGYAGAAPLQPGWERAYVLMDGSVQSHTSPTGDFTAFEKAGTASLAGQAAVGGQ